MQNTDGCTMLGDVYTSSYLLVMVIIDHRSLSYYPCKVMVIIDHRSLSHYPCKDNNVAGNYRTLNLSCRETTTTFFPDSKKNKVFTSKNLSFKPFTWFLHLSLKSPSIYHINEFSYCSILKFEYSSYRSSEILISWLVWVILYQKPFVFLLRGNRCGELCMIERCGDLCMIAISLITLVLENCISIFSVVECFLLLITKRRKISIWTIGFNSSWDLRIPTPC